PQPHPRIRPAKRQGKNGAASGVVPGRRLDTHTPRDASPARQPRWQFAYQAEKSGTRRPQVPLPDRLPAPFAPLVGLSRTETGSYTDWSWGDSVVGIPVAHPTVCSQTRLRPCGESLLSGGSATVAFRRVLSLHRQRSKP